MSGACKVGTKTVDQVCDPLYLMKYSHSKRHADSLITPRSEYVCNFPPIPRIYDFNRLYQVSHSNNEICEYEFSKFLPSKIIVGGPKFFGFFG